MITGPEGLQAADSVLRRPVRPEDGADAIAYLASPSVDYVTGRILAVDGTLRVR